MNNFKTGSTDRRYGFKLAKRWNTTTPGEFSRLPRREFHRIYPTNLGHLATVWKAPRMQSYKSSCKVVSVLVSYAVLGVRRGQSAEVQKYGRNPSYLSPSFFLQVYEKREKIGRFGTRKRFTERKTHGGRLVCRHTCWE